MQGNAVSQQRKTPAVGVRSNKTLFGGPEQSMGMVTGTSYGSDMRFYQKGGR
jgi:hypothetical protein